MAEDRGVRKVRVGIVLGDQMNKTRVVGVEWSMPHPRYKRRVRRLTRFKAHDEQNTAKVGDRVLISETRPTSKEKRWRIVQVLERAETVDVRPEEVDATLLKELQAKTQGSTDANDLSGGDALEYLFDRNVIGARCLVGMIRNANACGLYGVDNQVEFDQAITPCINIHHEYR